MQWLIFFAVTHLAATLNTEPSKPHSGHNSKLVRSEFGNAAYEEFRNNHGHRKGAVDAIDYTTRASLYHARVADITAHNAQRRSWVAGVNKFADYTAEELRVLLGYKREARSRHGPPSSPASLLQLDAGGQMIASNSPSHHHKAAEEVDWRTKTSTASTFIRDQGACGSCWAVAAVGALEMQAELKSGNTVRLSYDQLVDCVENPQHCGGTGGCNGATAELAFAYVHQHGLRGDASYSGLQHGANSALFGGASKTCSAGAAGSALAIEGWHTLPVNQGQPLMNALSNHGPVVLSVDGGAWMSYESGVFDGCEKNTVVNHAVLAVGYGNEGDKLYWLIRNSWGADWGDHGYIKILRHAHDDDYCGIDNNPADGVGCDGGPSELPICGMCGILSDSSHPVGAHVH